MRAADRAWLDVYNRVLLAGGTREGARDVATLRISQQLGAKDLEDILTDEPFWIELHGAFVERMRPAMERIFLEGIRVAAGLEVPAGRTRGKDILDPHPDVLGTEAGQAMRNYMDQWWRSLEQSTRAGLRDALTRAAQEGTGVQQVIRDISPLFGRARAELIGITETTRLFGAGAIATYRSSGMTSWIWRTVEDDRVCDICEPLAGRTFPIGTDFQPAHPRCRCFPSPGEDAFTQPAPPELPERFPEAGFDTHEDIRAFMGKKYPETDWSIFPPNKELGLGGFDLESANLTAQEFDRLLEQFPFMQDKLGSVAQMDGAEIAKGAAHESSYAYATWHDYGGQRVYDIRFNTNYYSDIKKLRAALARDIDDGWSPATGNDIRSVVTHEFGHAVDFALEQRARLIHGGMEKAYNELHALLSDKDLTRMVGDYATTNNREGWAEVFSMWAVGEQLPVIRSRILAEKMGKFIHDYS